jgi:hypothetical protein
MSATPPSQRRSRAMNEIVPANTPSFAFLIRVTAQGLEIELLRSATRNVV